MVEGKLRAIRRANQKESAMKSNVTNEVNADLSIIQSSQNTSLQSENVMHEKPYLPSKTTEKHLIFELYGENWVELPDSLKEMTYLKEWHINKTKIQRIPSFIELFQNLRILEMTQNLIIELPLEIGKLTQLKEMNLSFNKLAAIPPELGECVNLKRLDLAGNEELSELPFELSNLKKVEFLDISGNKFCSIPVCVLRMPQLKWLDVSSNSLKDLPEDIDRLEALQSLFLQKNCLTYLPMSLTKLSKLTMLIVSGDHLREVPSKICYSSKIKFITIKDNTTDGMLDTVSNEFWEDEQDRKCFEKEFMTAYFEDLHKRATAPSSTTRVSLSLQL
ncbi:leucine-rich repeat-containing protein 2 isoform X2 [Protopterus annectens]|nr:leucine-rich repeat-containing protein 2 isoform X2 [Protopterus annectens]